MALVCIITSSFIFKACNIWMSGMKVAGFHKIFFVREQKFWKFFFRESEYFVATFLRQNSVN